MRGYQLSVLCFVKPCYSLLIKQPYVTRARAVNWRAEHYAMDIRIAASHGSCLVRGAKMADGYGDGQCIVRSSMCIVKGSVCIVKGQ